MDVELDLFASCFQPCMSPTDRHCLVSVVLYGRCTSVAPVGTNSCGVGHGSSHGAVHDNSCVMLHGNSSGTIAYGNSRVERGHGDHRGTKPSSMSTWGKAWRPAVWELASFQQASGSVHDEAWAGRVQSSSLWISQEVEIETGCVVTVTYLPSPLFCS